MTPEQRYTLTQIPADLSDREIARYYTFTQRALDLIKAQRCLHNCLSFAVQLAVLRFPGRPLKDLANIPTRVLAVIADQVEVPASAFTRYGERDNTVYEHLDEIRRTYHSANVDGENTCGSLANCSRKRWKVAAQSHWLSRLWNGCVQRAKSTALIPDIDTFDLLVHRWHPPIIFKP